MPFFGNLTFKIKKSSISALWRSETGAATVIFGLTLAIFIGSTALMIDIARVLTVKSHLANFGESTVLSVTRNLNFLTAQELEALALATVSSMIRNTSLVAQSDPSSAITITVDTDQPSGRASVTITARVDTSLLQVFGFDEDFTVTQTVSAYQFAPIAAIAIVLESSNEMLQNGKLDPVRAALNEFVVAFDNHRKLDSAMVFSFLPFGNELVNIAPYTGWLEERVWPTEIPPNVPGTTDWEGDLAEGRWCVSKRTGNASNLDLTPDYSPFQLELEILKTNGPGNRPHYTNITSEDCRPEPIIPFSENTEAIRQSFTLLTGNGDVYAGRAMVWVERMLSLKWQSFWQTMASVPSSYDEHYQKVVILVIGSANTSPATEDSLFLEVCDRLKSKDVIIYVVDFLAPDTSTKLLETCATTKGHYFRAESPAVVSEALYAIAKFLTVVRFSG